MRRNPILLTVALATFAGAASSAAATFGTVVPLVGHAADIALDESRGVLYVANFTANRIEVLNLTDNTVHTSMNVASAPGGLALSRDGNYLVVTNYANWGTGVPPASANLITVINLASNTRQTFSTGDPPLGAAFVSTGSRSGMALITTMTGFYLLDPVSGAMQTIGSFANVAQPLPVPQATFPGQILQTAMAATPDGRFVWGIADAGTGSPQLIYQYDSFTGRMRAQSWITTPPLPPRVSVAADGSGAMIGWSLYMPAQCDGGFMVRSRFPGALATPAITGHAIDSKNGIIYAQIPDASQPTGLPQNPTPPAGTASSAKLPALFAMDFDNLNVREKYYLPENLVGRGVLNAAGSVMYAVSDSGVTILPVGTLGKSKRLAVSTEDLLVQSNFCNRNAMKQTFTISDPGGNKTDFSISVGQKGVTVSPSFGTTPATVTVTVDPSAMQNTFGTLAVPLTISSNSAVNIPSTVRLLISNPDQDQRGSIVNIPGTLSDILPDAARNRIYVVRQDKNQILVFDASNNQQKLTLRTGTMPTRMAFSPDGKSLLVASEHSQLLQSFDLDTLQPMTPIQLPASHYGRSIAQSNNGVFAVVENDAVPPGNVDRIDLVTRCAVQPPSLGVWENKVPETSVLTAAPGQGSILLAAPDGHVLLYDAQADAWVISRQDFTSLAGAFAASDPTGPPTASLPDAPTDEGTYVIGNNVLNPALVPIGTLDGSVGTTMGFSFTQGKRGYRVTGNTASGPGVIQNVAGLAVAPSINTRAVRVTEAPVLSTKDVPFTRTVAPMTGTVAVLTTSGYTVLSGNYDQAVAPPAISAITNAANGSNAVAPGGLISVYGSNMAATNVATSTIPLPTALGQSCMVVNGTLVPLVFVSSGQINAQLPTRISGAATLTIHTPGGVSDNYNFAVNPNAPSVFTSGTAGPLTGLATIVRADNQELVTPTNPIHTNDTVVIYLTGMGATSPAVDDGMPAPDSPLATTIVPPVVTLGGMPLNVSFAGLVPGYVGVYQINATVPFGVPQGLQIPLVIDQGGIASTTNVRVVK